jgi:TolB-like protein/class 3 adenylate cyclase/cytochrome c-type biogenesis protein CcmH/NrfG
MPGETSQVAAETRKLVAIMFTDMVGFSRQMGADEAHTLQLLAVHNQLIEQAVAAHQGHVIKTAGDGFLIEFPSVVHAVRCAQHIQARLQTYNADKQKNGQIHLRIGLHEGDILVQPTGDVLGDGVNIASRLQTFAEPDTICISRKVYDEVEKKIPLGTVISLGRPKLKNIAQRFQVYALLPEAPTGLRRRLQVQRLRFSRRVRPAHQAIGAALVLVMATVGVVRYFSPPIPSPQPPAPSTQSPTPSPQSLPLPDKPSIVVLPFDNMSGDPQQDYFNNGITEVLTSDLSRIPSLFVIARNTAFTYKGKATNVQAVGKELGVRYVLEGSVQKAGDEVRIVAQLIDTTTGGHLWSQRYDRPLKDIFALQDDIVQKIVTTLKLQLTLQEQGVLVRKATDNPEAYDAYLRGLEYFYRFTKEAHLQARQRYERAIELDPAYAAAYAFLGLTYAWGFSEWGQDLEALDRAFTLVQRAIALDDSSPEAHMALGGIYLWKKQHDLAIAEMKRVITLAPNEVRGYTNLGWTLSYSGRPEEAIGLLEKAIRFNPRDPILALYNLGFAYRLMRRYDEAVTVLKSVLTRNPDYRPAHAELAVIYSELGREEEARTEGAEILRISPDFSLEIARQRVPYKDPAELERFISALRRAGLQ